MSDLVVEQPSLDTDPFPHDGYRVFFSKETGDIIGFNRFISSTYPDDLDTMVHEFNEMFLFKFPEIIKKIPFTILGETFRVSVAHILSSLTGGSNLDGKPLSSEEVDNYLMINCKTSTQKWRSRKR